MYYILFHIGGIAILEMCFFFYYIGPMETIIFQNKIKNLVSEPFDNMDDSIRMSTLDESQIMYIQYFFIEENNLNQTAFEILKDERDKGIHEREEKNYTLFMKVLVYWSIFIGMSIFIALIQYMCFKEYDQNSDNYNKSVTNAMITNGEIEMEELPLYRRGSEDSDLETTIYCTEKKKKVCYKFLYYFIFAGCILGFQYLFFQYVVLKYDPYSMEEVKYIIYQYLQPRLGI